MQSVAVVLGNAGHHVGKALRKDGRLLVRDDPGPSSFHPHGFGVFSRRSIYRRRHLCFLTGLKINSAYGQSIR